MKALRFVHTCYFPMEGANAASLGLFCAIVFGLAASRIGFSQTSVQRDQQAITILTQTVAAGGGEQLLATIRDFTETGTVTYNFANQTTGNVTVKSRGLHQFRIDAELPEGKRTTVIDGEGGSLKEADGRATPIYRQSADDLGSLTLPYLPLITAIQDSSTSIVYGGLVTNNGGSCYEVTLQRVYTKEQDPQGNRGAREARSFYIDPQTYLVAAISDQIHSGGGLIDEGVPHQVLYSNYQSESGIMAPLTIVSTLRGVTEFTLNLSLATFNSGLVDSEFVR